MTNSFVNPSKCIVIRHKITIVEINTVICYYKIKESAVKSYEINFACDDSSHYSMYYNCWLQ